MYVVGTGADVRAWHVVPGMSGPEGQLHTHDYHLELIVESPQLRGQGWVCDLDALDAALAELVGRVADRDLEIIRPETAAAVTVEVFARWLHDELAETVRRAGGESLEVRVWESPTAFGGYRAAVA
ncbi:MAG: 6-pyruvoyl trahydropterin synthase family protein [Jiangellaceae bacterium]